MQANMNAAPSTRIERVLSLGKDAVALLRDGSLVLLAMLLLAFPGTLNDILLRAGFEEGSVVGFKWKAKFVQSDDSLKSAQTTIASLQEQLKKSNDALAAANTSIQNGELKATLQSVERTGREVATATAKVQDAVRATINSNAPLVEKAQAAMPDSGPLGVVFGSDVSLDAANDEISRATKKGIVGSEIFLRNGFYASIAVVESKERASEYLQLAKTFRPDAYVTRMASWCKSSQRKNGFTECNNIK